MPAEIDLGVHIPGCDLLHPGHDFITASRQGASNKDLGSQGDLFPYMQRYDGATGSAKYCQHGPTTGKGALLFLVVLVWIDLQDFS